MKGADGEYELVQAAELPKTGNLYIDRDSKAAFALDSCLTKDHHSNGYYLTLCSGGGKVWGGVVEFGVGVGLGLMARF